MPSQMRRSLFAMLALLSTAIMAASCGKRQLPGSNGRPYEVVLEGDTDSIVTGLLTEPTPGLPQPEPMFDLIQQKSGSGKLPLSRLRVIVRILPESKAPKTRRATDIKATPQTIILIEAPSAESLRQEVTGKGAELRNLLDQVELEHLATLIKQHPEKQKEVKQAFGVNMKIPSSMNSSKKGKDFLWLSNNSTTGLQSLLFFPLPKESNREETLAQIDSILRTNIMGEEDGMYMRIATSEVHESSKGTERWRGLWEMQGDAMGGSYVMQITGQGSRRMAVMGFVYAPEMKKRNLTKQLEAMLTTIGQEADIATK